MTTRPDLSTTSELPDPFVPEGIDLRKKDYMPLHGDTLLTSTAWNLAPLEARGPMVQLWWHAWSKQVPAGSLPNEDGELIAMAGLQARPDLWTTHRAAILRGFVLCSDGRLYHGFLAELIHELLENRRFKAGEVRAWRMRNKNPVVAKPGDVVANEADVVAKSGGVVPKISTRDDTIRDDTIRDDKTKGLRPLSEGSDRGALAVAVQDYNDQAARFGWPICIRLSKAREKQLAARLRQHGGDGWREGLARAACSSFLTKGEGARDGWVPDFDFFVQEKSFNRLVEGKYDDRKRANSGGMQSGSHGSGATGAALKGILDSGGDD